MHRFTNHLIQETSPYLLQHAHNPVNWYPWNEESLRKAKEENKPILVSIGYAACHWCHVMERESFEDEATAAIMNKHFINIKIDREERPDLDLIYMDAVQVMTGSGGWPLNVFLMPDARPFYGGTYFPPRKAFNRPSWQEVLSGVIDAFQNKNHEIETQAENLTRHLLQSNSFGLQKDSPTEELFTPGKLDETFQSIMKSADKEWGGFGGAPKFPQTFTIQFLLRYHYVNNIQNSGKSKPPLRMERGSGAEALDQALLSLDKMISGGIYDQVGGGFSRYSTDKEWLVPHFEKMLYDNALLLSVISEASQLTGKERYKETIEESMEFVQRELVSPDKGFYSALDADSEGEEGKFYVWNEKEVKKILGKEAEVFCEYYDITGKGNWSERTPGEEEKNILRIKEPIEKMAVRKNIEVDVLKDILEKGRKKLLEQRSKRIHPPLDDKIILGWNALMNTACSKAYAATGNEQYRQLAVANMQFLFTKFSREPGNGLYHTWKNEVAKHPAFLDDYAFLVQGLIHLQEITGDSDWLLKAKEITEFVIHNFTDADTGLFFYTRSGQSDIILRKKEIYDGAIPSGNSVMAYNLYQLSILFDKKEWLQQSFSMVRSLEQAITRHPTSFGIWACLLQEIITGTSEIAVVGERFYDVLVPLLRQYIPHRVLMGAKTALQGLPLVVDKPSTTPPSIYLCRNYTCHRPVFSVNELISLINNSPTR